MFSMLLTTPAFLNNINAYIKGMKRRERHEDFRERALRACRDD